MHCGAEVTESSTNKQHHLSLKVYMELGSYFLFLQEQIKDIIIKLLTVETESRLGTFWDEEQCMQLCSKDELWEAAKEKEMKIPWKENKEFLAIEFKRTQDTRSNHVEKAIVVAQEQYTSLVTGLQAVGQVKGWKVQQLVFVGGTCGSVHVESFNKNMKALGVLESKWDLIRQKLVRRLLEELAGQGVAGLLRTEGWGETEMCIWGLGGVSGGAQQ
jgi:hypothetical protein